MDINRKTAMEILTEVEVRKAYSNIALNGFISANKPDNQALVREIVYGVLKNKLFIDQILSQLISSRLNKLKGNTLTILRMGIYQLIFMHSIPEYAAVNESVNLAKKFLNGQSGFINGVLRGYIRKKSDFILPNKAENIVGYLSVKYSYSEWIVKLWLSIYDEAFVEELLGAGNETPRLSVRVNRLKENPDALLKTIMDEGFEVESSQIVQGALYVKGSNLLKSPIFLNGGFSVQDESSMLSIDLLDPRPGEFVIDVCAAPGGKALYIAEKMQNQGRVVAWDIYSHKLELLKKAAFRTGATIIETEDKDSTIIDSRYINLADRVLVDAPCSGLGVIRRKPEIKYSEDQGQIEALSHLQLELLQTSSSYVKPGGVLFYSTCTISPSENEQVVEKFLSMNSLFELKVQKQLFPNVDGTDGFYMAKLIKKK